MCLLITWQNFQPKLGVNNNHPIAKDIRNIKLLYLNKNSLKSLVLINDVLDLPKTKVNLLFLGQFSEQKVDIKTRSSKIYLY